MNTTTVKRILPCLSVIAVVLAGCDNVSERDCGVFDHPEFSLWQADQDEALLTYMSSPAGERIIFNRQAVEYSTPFLGSDGASNDEDVVCELTATVRMEATDGSLALSTVYRQLEQFFIESSEEVLLVDNRVESPAGTPLAGNYPADISVNRTRLRFDPTRVQYVDAEQNPTAAEFNGLAYEDVIRISAPATPVADEEVAAASVIQQIVLAREVGIVAFTDSEGREFSLVSTQ